MVRTKQLAYVQIRRHGTCVIFGGGGGGAVVVMIEEAHVERLKKAGEQRIRPDGQDVGYDLD